MPQNDPQQPAQQQPQTPPPITNQVRQDWNSYVDWLAQQGLKGNPILDHNDLAGRMLDQYQKVNPNTTINRDIIVPLQNEFQNYRNYALSGVKNGTHAFAPGVNEDNFMKSLSQVDGIAGQRTTSFKFPEDYLQTFINKKPVSFEDKGFATTNK
jgi:hypothetical protein